MAANATMPTTVEPIPTEQPAKKLHQFRVLRGCHSEGGKIYEVGDVVTTTTDLARRMNRPGMARKFMPLEEYINMTQAIEPMSTASTPTIDWGTVEKMSLNDLRQLAIENGITLEAGISKNQVLAALHSYLDAKR